MISIRSRDQRKPASLLALVALCALVATARAQAGPDSVEKAFVSGGRIEMQLEAGAYEVRPSSDNRIHVAWTSSTTTVNVTVNINGTHADLKVANTPHNNFRARIEIPAAADVKIRLTAGELRVGGIKGSKDVALRAGDLDISVGEPDDYGKVECSVRAGDLNAAAFGVSKGGLFRSFKWTGKGKYTLSAHLIAGDLNLHK